MLMSQSEMPKYLGYFAAPHDDKGLAILAQPPWRVAHPAVSSCGSQQCLLQMEQS